MLSEIFMGFDVHLVVNVNMVTPSDPTSCWNASPAIFGCVHKIAKKRLLTLSSVCPSAWNNSAATGHICMKFYIWTSFTNLPKNSSFMKIWPEDQHNILIISSLIFLIMGNTSDKSSRESQNRHFMFINVFLKIWPFIRCFEKLL
jgi:hypothetical protein